MGWMMKVIVLVALQYISPLCGVPHLGGGELQPLDDNYGESTGVLEDENTDVKQLPESIDPEKLDLVGNYLTALLMLPWNGKGLPLLYIEDEPADGVFSDLSADDEQQYTPEISPAPFKRSRYYRKYPWKRQNSRQTRQNRHSSFLYATKYNTPKMHPRVIKHNKKEDYDADNRYLCQPSKDDVLRLLVALHEARQGTRGRTINFCNRKRPATAIFTNIRFLG